MIVFLTLLYVGLLALLVKLKLVRLTLFWKISPLIWMLVLFLVLFIPMQWGAPAGQVVVYQTIVEVVPNVSGQVTEAPAQPMTPLKRGDILFQIDPVPFQAKVDQLQATLAETIQHVKQLEASANSAAAAVEMARQEVTLLETEKEAMQATIAAAEATRREAQANATKARTLADDLSRQLTVAEREVERLKSLLAQQAVAEATVDDAIVKFTGLESQRNAATADVEAKQQALLRSAADLTRLQVELKRIDLKEKQLLETGIPQAEAEAERARLAASSRIGDEHTSVAAVRAQLEQAQFDLEQTTVRAPGNGFVVAATLRPGQRVANMPMRSWMSFVNEEENVIAMAVTQNNARFVELGQPAEVTLKLYPGKTFPARVTRVAMLTPDGQLPPSGLLPNWPATFPSGTAFAIVLTLDEQSGVDVRRLPGGAVGTAAVFTEKSKAAHVIRKVMIRMTAWMNYVF